MALAMLPAVFFLLAEVAALIAQVVCAPDRCEAVFTRHRRRPAAPGFRLGEWFIRRPQCFAGHVLVIVACLLVGMLLTGDLFIATCGGLSVGVLAVGVGVLGGMPGPLFPREEVEIGGTKVSIQKYRYSLSLDDWHLHILRWVDGRGKQRRLRHLDVLSRPVLLDGNMIAIACGLAGPLTIGRRLIVRPLYPPPPSGSHPLRAVRVVEVRAASGEMDRVSTIPPRP